MIAALVLAAPLSASTPALHANPQSGLPILFEPNRGQSTDDVCFLARAAGGQVLIRQNGLTLRTRNAGDQQLNFDHSLSTATPEAKNAALTRINYLSRSRSLRDIPTYRQVRYTELYPGIDLLAYGAAGNFEFDVILKPGADLSRFAMDVSSDASIGGKGELHLGRAFTLRAPVAYQMDARGQRHEVAVAYALHHYRVTLTAGRYDSRLALTVDPQLVMTYGTYLSGSNGSTIYGVASDSSGDVYVAGTDSSNDFPTHNALQTTGTTFISKLDPSGTTLIYSTFIAGATVQPGPANRDSNAVAGHTLAVDATGNAYLVGSVVASDSFPLTSNAYPYTPLTTSSTVGFLLKLSADGSQIPYATYAFDAGYSGAPISVAVDTSGVAYVAGTAGFNSLPTTGNAYMPSIATSNVESSFIEKFDATRSGSASLLYSSYFGFNGISGFDVACDNAGHAFLLGSTLLVSTGHGGTAPGTITTRNAIQAAPPGNVDAFVAEFDTTASGDASLVAATYIGGTGNDYGTSIALDSSNNIYITGTTTSGDFLANPVANGAPVQSNLLSAQNGFVTKIAVTGSALTLLYSTYIGNTSTTAPTGIAALADGEAFVTGTATAGLATLSGLTVPVPTGSNADNFLADLSPTGQSYVYSSYLGNMVQTGGTGSSSFVALNGDLAVVAGTWSNSASPLAATTGAIQTTAPASGTGGFITKYVFPTGTAPFVSNVTPARGSNVSAVSFTINGGGFQGGATVSLNASGGAVQAQLLTVSSDGRTITGTFDLRGVSAGPADLVVTNPDTTSATLSQGFTVDAANNDQIFTQVLGPSGQRIGGGMVYTILYGNSGNTDEFGVPLFITFNNTFKYQVLSPLTTQDNANSGGHLDFSQGTLDYDDGNGNTVLMLFLPVIKAGSTAAVRVLLTAPASQTYILSSYQIQSQLFPPVFAVGPVGTTMSALPRLPSGIQIAGLSPPDFFAHDKSQTLPSFLRDLVPTASGDRLFANLSAALHPPKTHDMFWQSGSPEQPQWVKNLVYTQDGRRCISNMMQTAIDYLSDGIGLIPGVNCVASAAVGMFATQTKIQIGTALDSTYQAPSQMYQNISNGLDAASCIPIVGESKAVFNGVKHTIFATYYLLDCASVAGSGQGILGTVIGGRGSLLGQFFGAFDPNLKSGPVGAGTLQWIAPPQSLNYSIEFQNDPTATAPTQTALVVDAINSNVIDLSSIAFGPVVVGTHMYTPLPNSSTINTTIDLRPDVDMLVQVQASVDTGGSDLIWQFTSIDPTTGQPLPSGSVLGFLPPDTPAPAGEGNLSFTARLKSGVTTGTSLTNGASVIFDANPPIFTPIWANTIDADAPVSSVTPLPATESSPIFPVAWSGTDNGSGIGSYTIFVSQNGGAFTPWLTNTALTTAMYPGTAGSTYAFFSIAQDAAGNSETLKTTADASASTAVNAVAAPGASLSATSLDFHATTVHSSNGPQSITLTNNGNAVLSISSASIGGGDSSAFILGGSCGSSIPAGMACTLTVTFLPSAAGTLSSTLTFTDNASNSPQTVALNGTAADGSTTSTTTLAASSTQVSVHQPVTLTATITPTSAGTPTGTVNFYTGSVLLGTSTLNAGIATLLPASLPSGTNSVTAIYSGDANYGASTSNAVAINISPQDIWVVSTDGTVNVLDNAGVPAIAPLSGGTSSIAIDNSGNVWTPSSANSLIEFNSSGSQLGVFTGGGLNAPTALAISGAGVVWITNGNNTLSIFANTGSAISPTQGLSGGGLNTPSAIAIDTSGSIWVANSGNNTVTEFLGATDPVVAPVVAATANSNLGTKP